MKDFNIILEGCDATGKTTIYEMLLKAGYCQLGMHYDPPKSMMDGKRQYQSGVRILNRTKGIIFDRFMLGECVYAPMIRGYKPNYMRKLEKELADHNILVMLTADLDTIKQRFDGEFLTEGQLEECLNKYDEEFEACNWTNKIRIDTTDNRPHEVVDIILKFIKKELNIKWLK